GRPADCSTRGHQGGWPRPASPCHHRKLPGPCAVNVRSCCPTQDGRGCCPCRRCCGTDRHRAGTDLRGPPRGASKSCVDPSAVRWHAWPTLRTWCYSRRQGHGAHRTERRAGGAVEVHWVERGGRVWRSTYATAAGYGRRKGSQALSRMDGIAALDGERS